MGQIDTALIIGALVVASTIGELLNYAAIVLEKLPLPREREEAGRPVRPGARDVGGARTDRERDTDRLGPNRPARLGKCPEYPKRIYSVLRRFGIFKFGWAAADSVQMYTGPVLGIGQGLFEETNRLARTGRTHEP